MTQPDEDFQEDTAAAEELRPATQDLEAPPVDAFEQTLPVHPEDLAERPHVGLDVSEADAIEQALLAVPSHHDDTPRVRPDVSEADAIEQARGVEIQDDDYE